MNDTTVAFLGECAQGWAGHNCAERWIAGASKGLRA